MAKCHKAPAGGASVFQSGPSLRANGSALSRLAMTTENAVASGMIVSDGAAVPHLMHHGGRAFIDTEHHRLPAEREARLTQN